jgi:hypothetical protein
MSALPGRITNHPAGAQEKAKLFTTAYFMSFGAASYPKFRRAIIVSPSLIG